MSTYVTPSQIRKGDKIRAEICHHHTKAVEYVAEKDADHRGFDAAHFLLDQDKEWGPYPDPDHLGVGASFPTPAPPDLLRPPRKSLFGWFR